MTEPAKKTLRQRLLRLYSEILWTGFALAVVGIGAMIAGYYYLASDLPALTSLSHYRPPIITEVYADDGTLIAEFADERRRLINSEDLPKDVIMAFIATEDFRFMDHQGVDWQSVPRAAIGRYGGASTITMQVARSFFLTPERSYIRKMKESILAYRIEKYLNKMQILSLYLNQVDFGRSCFGIGAASEYYFGKPAAKLTLAEAAMLAGILPAPSRLNPVSSFTNAKNKQWHVLKRMADKEVGFITQPQAEDAFQQPIKIIGDVGPRGDAAPYFVEQVRRTLINDPRYGRDAVYKQGLKVFTTVNLKADQAAQRALRHVIIGKDGIDRNLGFRRDKIVHLSAPAVQALLDQQEQGFGRDWLRGQWSDALAKGETGDSDYGKLKASIPDPAPLDNGAVYKAIVVKVDDKAPEVRVKIGHSSGVVDKKGMAWVKTYLEKDKDGEMQGRKFLRPSQLFASNDQIEVKVLDRQTGADGKPFYRLALEEEPEIQGAIFSMAVRTGHVKALVGGLDYGKSEFIRAIQARRQPGSAFKPIVYAAALDAQPPGRYTAATIVLDAPIVFDVRMKNRNCPDDPPILDPYKPKNYDGTFTGVMTLRDALAYSRNVIAVKAAWDVCLSNVVDYAHKIGVTSPLDVLPCIGLGCSEVTLDELAAVYNVFATGGYYLEPTYIARVYDRDGNLLEYEPKPSKDQLAADSGKTLAAAADPPGDSTSLDAAAGDTITEEDITDSEPAGDSRATGHYFLQQATPPQQIGEPEWQDYLARIKSDGHDWIGPANYPLPENARAMNPQTAFIITDMLRSVAVYGTGSRAAVLHRPVAGKTGTTNNYRDAWFIGYTPELLTGVWVGPDDYAYSLGRGESGSKAALPVWVDYMRQVLYGRPTLDFPVPRGIQWARIDKSDGLRASDCTLPENSIIDPFIKGTAPEAVHPCSGITSSGQPSDMMKFLELGGSVPNPGSTEK